MAGCRTARIRTGASGRSTWPGTPHRPGSLRRPPRLRLRRSWTALAIPAPNVRLWTKLTWGHRTLYSLGMATADQDNRVSTAPHRKIIHIDMDAFYASVEQRDNPDLRSKPVAVGGSAERGVVAAASYEARQYGVRSAMPSVTANRQCPDLIFVKPRFEVYKAVSRQIREIFAEHTPIIEPLSLDEAYLDVTENLQGILLARDVALRIREKIKAETGLNASAGISYNKFLAKLASDHRKPNGQYVISPEMGPTFVETLPVGKFHGIGPATAAKFNDFGIWTGLDMRNQTLEFLNANFGKSGAYYYWISRGIDERPV